MNDPWAGRTELSIDMGEHGMENFFNLMISECVDGFEVTSIDKQVFGVMLGKYDAIIYTIPVNSIAEHYNIPTQMFHTGVISLKAISGRSGTGKLWWDYLYVPSAEFPFHRVSKRVDGALDFEVSAHNYGDQHLVRESVLEFCGEHLHIDVRDVVQNGTNKGHVIGTVDRGVLNSSVGDGKVFLLGRYAQQDSRMTWDKVVKRVQTDMMMFVDRSVK